MALLSKPKASSLCSDTAAWFVLLMCQLLALTYALLGGPHGFWWRLAMASLYAHWVGLVGLLLLCQWQRAGFDGSQRHHWVLYWLTLSATTLLGLATGHYLLLWLLPAQAAPSYATSAMQALAIVLFCALLLRYWYLQQSLALRQQAVTQAQLDALQARINPHFLFNALNAIAALVRQDARQAEQAVEQLSDLMRASLQPHQTLIPLHQEIALTEAYVGLEQARFGARLQVHWAIDEALRDFNVPIMSVQPLVENAVRHGVGRRLDGGTITITAAALENHWTITVSNPLGPTDSTDNGSPGNGLALTTLQARGTALLGETFALQTLSTSEQFIAQMDLPMVLTQPTGTA